LINTRKINYLKSVVVTHPVPEPSLAVIIAVRNEEEDVQEALESMCRLNYRNYRLIVINDRSTDSTPEILTHFEKQYSHVTVIHVDTLPEGWLGKNHALYTGYKVSDEKWMLFTDADIRYTPDTVNKAIQYCINKNLDHLTVLPEVNSRSTFFNSIMDTFKIMLNVKLKPWEAPDPKSKSYFGVGAFNLVKRSAYEVAGTHQRIALRPDDDLKLGQAIKFSGFKQEAVFGDGLLKLEWYTSVKAFIQGLMKNTFSTVDYHFGKIIISCIATFLFFVLPLPLLLLAGGTTERLMAGVILLFQILLFVLGRGMRGVWWYALMVPVASSIMIYIMWKSATLTLKQGGIYWRDSFYPLHDLKKYINI
jgi:glycosyltransferase involved in cell wall biosynthesis